MVDCMNGSNALNTTSPKTQSAYLRRIGRALEFIDQNLGQVIRLEDVARASCFSAYHFHRIFHALVGETVNDYISRKRMERAIRLLMYQPGLSVTEVALAGGFSSSANFSKAFKQYFGVAPSAIRNPGNGENSKTGKLYRKYGKAFNPLDLYSQFVTQTGVFDPTKLEDMLMQVKIVTKEAQPIAYLSSPRGYELDSVYATWDKLTQWAEAQGVSVGASTSYALCHDNPTITPEDKCRYDASVVISDNVRVTAPFKQAEIPAGKYAVAYYKDTADKISNFMTEFCANWFCNSNYEPDDYPPIFNYLNTSREDDCVEMNVYIKLKDLVA